MKKIIVLLSIVLIVSGAMMLFLQKNSKIQKVNTKNDIKDKTNILVSGKFNFPETKILDNEYNIRINYPIAKAIKEISSSQGWKEDTSKEFSSKGYINDICISNDIYKEILNEKLITNYSEDTEILNDKIVPMRYEGDTTIYLTTMEETGFWRLKYYRREIDTSKTYTVIGKWDGEKVVPIEGMEKSIYEGEVQIEKFENTKMDISINMYIGIALIALGVILILIRLIIAINKK